MRVDRDARPESAGIARCVSFTALAFLLLLSQSLRSLSRKGHQIG